MLLKDLNDWLVNQFPSFKGYDHSHISDEIEDVTLMYEVVGELCYADFSIKAKLTDNANECYLVLDYNYKKYQCLIWYDDDKLLIRVGKYFKKDFMHYAKLYGIL